MKQETKEVDFKLMHISSPAFLDHSDIPSKYTCDGENVSPPLNIQDIPHEAACLAIIVDDPDAPVNTWVHWVCWNIPVTHQIRENEIHGQQGVNDFGKYTYSGPCPPKGVHHYHFKIYALDAQLELPADITKYRLEKAMSEHILAFGELVGLYQRKNN